MAKILVVDDEKLLVKGMKFNLENEGYQVECAYDGAAAVELARDGRFDLIVLDVMMPEVDGLEACMRIREFSNVPIIMLTAKSEDADKLMGFESGADDYLTKPFNILELKARVRALLRRAGLRQDKGAVLTVGNITLNTQERVAVRNGETVDLTAKEYDLIELLMRNPRRVYSRENLMNVVWGYTYARRLPDRGRPYPAPAGEAGGEPGGAGPYHDQVGSGVLFQGIDAGSSAACSSSLSSATSSSSLRCCCCSTATRCWCRRTWCSTPRRPPSRAACP